VGKQGRCIGAPGGVVAGPVPHDGNCTVTREPALGPHPERRFVGCLRDLGVDGVSGRLVNLQRTGS
ncbi:hypothetical protein, partial [Nocardia wallacei]|uniref:hypothetical protein n=1 Tax=Nocardia wallacei TaxID=480035 RepID=UPI00245559C5